MIAPPERGEHFRPDVEGLRALAVVLVLLYHADVPFFGGGYVGVDVFFVISGFLITSLLLRELDSTGRLSFSGFYARRVRRLLPASALTLLVTLVASIVLLSPVRMPDVAADIAAAGAYISNFRFGLAANDYFQANAAPSPVLHFWSLSVEEQFYFVWPSVLLVTFALARRLRVGRRGLFIGVALLSAASLLACIWLTGVNQAWAFYLLPTRAWELGAGALLAIGAGHVRLPGRRTAAIISTVGLVAVALAALLFTEQTAFPGYAAILPVAGTAMVIFGGTRAESLPARLLSLPPCTFLGGISYSVYLWHWPMLLFAGVLYGASLPLPLAVLVALASIPVATVTQRLVEKPFRAGRFIGTRARFNLSQAVASTLVIALLAGAANVYARSRVDATLTDLIPPLIVANVFPTEGWCDSPDDAANPVACVHGDSSSKSTIVLFGDSHAWHWYPAFQQMAIQYDLRLVTLTRGRCPSVPVEAVNDLLKAVDPECELWREKAFARVVAEHPDLVIFSNFARRKLVVNGATVSDRADVLDAWLPALATAIQRALASAKAVAVLGDVPAGVDVPSCLAQHPDDFAACARPLSAADPDWHASERAVVESLGGIYVDPTPWLCDVVSCPAVIGRYIAYIDISHLTGPFAASLEPNLRAVLAPHVAALSAPLATPLGPTDTASLAPSPFLSDTFSRSVSAGWGQPGSGPAWFVAPPEGASVDGNAGQLTMSTAPGSVFARASVTATDVDISARFSLDALPAGTPLSVHFWPRIVDADDQYRFYLSVFPSGEVFGTFSAVVGGTASTLGSAPAGSAYTPGSWWQLRVQATGSGPTSLRARVWAEGTPEPASWALELSDATASLQAPSQAVQLGVYAGAGETQLPLRVAFDDVQINVR